MGRNRKIEGIKSFKRFKKRVRLTKGEIASYRI